MICCDEKGNSSNALLSFLQYGEVVLILQPNVDHCALGWFKASPHSDTSIAAVGQHGLAPWHALGSQRVKLTDTGAVFPCDQVPIPQAALDSLELRGVSVPPDGHPP